MIVFFHPGVAQSGLRGIENCGGERGEGRERGGGYGGREREREREREVEGRKRISGEVEKRLK